MEVKRRRPPRAPGERLEPVQPPPWEREQWVDEGAVRDVAASASKRARRPAEDASPTFEGPAVSEPVRQRAKGQLDPEQAAVVERAAGSGRAGRYTERLTSAAEALDRGRFDDARRMVQPVLRDLPDIALGHELAGLSLYGVGQWRKAASELELARQLDGSVRHHAVLADCYRALRRYRDVDRLWDELKAASPDPALMAEGRIVAAGALADQGDLQGAITLMGRSADVPKRVRDHHLRQWYVLGDLHDRAGNVVEARRFFRNVVEVDATFADVSERLQQLGH